MDNETQKGKPRHGIMPKPNPPRHLSTLPFSGSPVLGPLVLVSGLFSSGIIKRIDYVLFPKKCLTGI